MSRFPPALVALLLAGCGGSDGESAGSVTANQIERLSTPKVEKIDVRASARLQPLSSADLARAGLAGAGCRFTSAGRLLLVSVGSDSMARIEGELRHFVQSAPVGESGAFLEDRQVSISIGRTEAQGQTVDEGRGWPARATVTNRRTDQQHETAGLWSCGA